MDDDGVNRVWRNFDARARLIGATQAFGGSCVINF